jgi:hypothetical protein
MILASRISRLASFVPLRLLPLSHVAVASHMSVGARADAPKLRMVRPYHDSITVYQPSLVCGLPCVCDLNVYGLWTAHALFTLRFIAAMPDAAKLRCERVARRCMDVVSTMCNTVEVSRSRMMALHMIQPRQT